MNDGFGPIQPVIAFTSDPDQRDDHPARRGAGALIAARLLIGLIVLLCAEVFSGASLGMGLWHPWTLIVTYWLYFAHFFFFTTLAIWTGRTSLGSLYLWGVLFGLYESWITKVIWYGYGGDGQVVMGWIGPYGYSEISMVFIFHPVASFLLPLAAACLIWPSLRRWFPDLAWLTGTGRWARVVQFYLVLCFAPIVGMNSGGAVNLLANLAALALSAGLLWRLARRGGSSADARRLVCLGRGGFIASSIYLAALYGLTYALLRPEGLPSPGVQAFTLAFYAAAIAGLALARRREPIDAGAAVVPPRERRVAWTFLASVLGLGLFVAATGTVGWVGPLILANFVIWTPLGFLLTLLAIGVAASEAMNRA